MNLTKDDIKVRHFKDNEIETSDIQEGEEFSEVSITVRVPRAEEAATVAEFQKMIASTGE